MDWRESVVFSRKPEDILQMDFFELCDILGVETRLSIIEKTRDLLKAVTFDFLARNGVSQEEAEAWIREDTQDLCAVRLGETKDSALQNFLISYVSEAMAVNHPGAAQALAVAVRGAELLAQKLREVFKISTVTGRETHSYSREEAELARQVNRGVLGLPDEGYSLPRP